MTCVGGMGVYRISPSGEVSKVTDEAGRSPLSIVDDSRLRAPGRPGHRPADGRIFFSEATIRYEMSSWALDALEGRGQRPDHVLRSPHRGRRARSWRNLIFPNGLCLCPDGPILPLRGDMGLQDQPALVRGAAQRRYRGRHRRPSRLSRQHQSRVRRPLLGRAPRHAKPGASTWPCAGRRSASGWHAASHRTSGSSRTSTRAAC